MPFGNQRVLPAIKQMKELEKLLASSYEYLVLLGGRIGALRPIVEFAERNGKKILLHADLIDGLKNDEYAAEFLCQQIRPAGLISTRVSVIQKTKQNGLISIQRMFVIDSDALDKSVELAVKTKPDFVEMLPGVMPHLIAEVRERTGVPVIAGGLIRSSREMEDAFAAGAAAITTSRQELWKPSFGRGGT
ncbi:glycerol-3-phosphate responsive antiterminator [Cohnella luojiensis]|uniref:Glycerol uptake operon antiterminator regulatory protein n=1 Tax=Cohnella luojiensis TaxID=652876 RepID=A0A4Y8LTJ7_9BACL|nr:glycerol-3-phosphate responsive antiterminator [Cohnella luojiensis]TFE24725.1 glycerol-3-phosphate responsive antiterminator [Cohnella luojiensis]